MGYIKREFGDQETENRVKGLVEEVRTMLDNNYRYNVIMLMSLYYFVDISYRLNPSRCYYQLCP